MRRWAILCVITLLLSGCAKPPSEAEGLDDGPRGHVSFNWVPQTPGLGDAVRFGFQGSIPSDVDIAAVAWDFGDGTADERQPTHQFWRVGDQVVNLTVTLSDGSRLSHEDTVTVIPYAEAHQQGEIDWDAPALAEGTPPTILLSQDGNKVSLAFEWDREADLVGWDFGDGVTSSEQAPLHEYHSKGSFEIRLHVADSEVVGRNTTTVVVTEIPFIPHVVVGVADSGFNVYHEVYRRPELVSHPCTYIEDYPCDIPALNLTLDADTWQEAFQADKEIWESIKPGDRYWIPGTNIIGALCVMPYSYNAVTEAEDPTVGKDYCILDDTEMHGTGTSSSVLSENPDALLIVAEGKTTAREDFATGEFPVDIISHSWGSAVPTPLPCSGRYSCTPQLFEVAASGNEGSFPVVLDRTKSYPNYMNIGAADAGSRSEPGYWGWKTMDYVSESCRETADTRTLTGMRDQFCGTSFSAPTFAGAMSRVVLELRQRSGYTGGISHGMVDPILGISMMDVREAINHTATYEPEDKWDDGDDLVPLVAPWYQWGWGYFDSTRVDATLDCILDDICPERPFETVTYMELLWTYRTTTNP